MRSPRPLSLRGRQALLAAVWIAGLAIAVAGPRQDTPPQAPAQQPTGPAKVTIPPAVRSWQSSDGAYGFNVEAWAPDSWYTENRVMLLPEGTNPDDPPAAFEIPDGTITVTNAPAIRSGQSVNDIDRVYNLLVQTLEHSPSLHEKIKEGASKQGVTSIAIRLVRGDSRVTGGMWRRNSNLVVIDLADLEADGASLTPAAGVAAADAAAATSLFAKNNLIATLAHELDHVRDGEGEFWHSDPADAGAQGLAPLDENHVLDDLDVPIIRPAYWQSVNGDAKTVYNVNGVDMYLGAATKSTATSTGRGEAERLSAADAAALQSLPARRCGAAIAGGCFAGAGSGDSDWDGIGDRRDNCPAASNANQAPICLDRPRPTWALTPSLSYRSYSSLAGATFGAEAQPDSNGPQTFFTDFPITTVPPPPPARPLPQLMLYQRPQAAGEFVRLLLTSTGRSTGPAMQLTVVNRSTEPLQLTGGRIVLEPVRSLTARDVDRERQRLRATGAPITANAYCLDFSKPVPAAGVVYRIASADAQRRAAAARDILAASQHLRVNGGIHPDSDPDDYFHSIRQWALWTHREGFDQAGFVKAFGDHTRKNFAAARRPWTAAVEQGLRQVLPGRWQDIQAILREAGLAR